MSFPNAKVLGEETFDESLEESAGSGTFDAVDKVEVGVFDQSDEPSQEENQLDPLQIDKNNSYNNFFFDRWNLPYLEASISECCSCCHDALSSLPLARDTLPRVHEGFWTAYEKVRRDVLLASLVAVAADVKNIMEMQLNSKSSRNLDTSFVKGDPYVLEDISSPLQFQFTGRYLAFVYI
jgi:hypothetical protein